MAGIWRRFFRKKKEPPYCAAVVAAAGEGTRMGHRDKVLLPLGSYPVLAYTLAALEKCPLVNETVVVTREDLMLPIAQLCKENGFTKIRSVVVGGETRTQSVYAGVNAVSDEATVIAIQDGARPFASQRLLREVIAKAMETGAAAPAVPVKDTIKVARDGLVEKTLERGQLFAVQTPQVFEASLIKAALRKSIEENISMTDDCAAVERLGMSVALTRGEETNLKLTTPTDVIVAYAILEGRAFG